MLLCKGADHAEDFYVVPPIAYGLLALNSSNSDLTLSSSSDLDTAKCFPCTISFNPPKDPTLSREGLRFRFV